MKDYTHPSHGYLLVGQREDPAKSSVESPKGWLALAASMLHDPFKQTTQAQAHAQVGILEVRVSK